MSVCGCGQSLVGAPPIIDGGLEDDQGIIVSGTFDNTVITAAAAVAWRPMLLPDFNTTNFEIGDGEYNVRYLRDGYNVDVIMSFRFASGSTFNALPWEVFLPWTPQGLTGVINNHGVLGMWSAFDEDAINPWYQGTVIRMPSGLLGFREGDDLGATNSLVEQGTPFTFTAGDEFSFQARYETDDN